MVSSLVWTPLPIFPQPTGKGSARSIAWREHPQRPLRPLLLLQPSPEGIMAKHLLI